MSTIPRHLREEFTARKPLMLIIAALLLSASAFALAPAASAAPTPPSNCTIVPETFTDGNVELTGWERLDPINALLVALNIVRTGVQLLRRSTGGLMDHALGPAEQAEIQGGLATYREDGVEFHAPRTRQAGRRAFVSLHLLVPGAWTAQQGHELAERVERDLRQRLPYATVFTHVEPREDAASFDDVRLDRSA
jgi:hypothetical protein